MGYTDTINIKINNVTKECKQQINGESNSIFVIAIMKQKNYSWLSARNDKSTNCLNKIMRRLSVAILYHVKKKTNDELNITNLQKMHPRTDGQYV